MPIHLESKDILNTQHMEVAVHGPDGATHLILCTGFARLESASRETYTFLVGPPLSRRQFVAAIASAAISTTQGHRKHVSGQEDEHHIDVDLLRIDAAFDGDACQVRVKVEASVGPAVSKVTISYNVSILAELQNYER